MINRIAVKEAMRHRISQNRGNAIVVCLLLQLLVASYSFVNVEGPHIDISLGEEFAALFAMIAAVLMLVISVYSLFVGNVIYLGGMGWFLCYARGENPEVSRLFGAFRFYKSALCTTLLKSVYVFLWSLLFVIPGIVKAYAYSMAEYLLCENPSLSASKALELSNRITQGHKGELFTLDLSFFGWNLLSAFTMGILGIVYVNPYYYATHATYYLTLKEMALQQGIVRPEELTGN